MMTEAPKAGETRAIAATIVKVRFIGCSPSCEPFRLAMVKILLMRTGDKEISL
jgi:hypothetical protein